MLCKTDERKDDENKNVDLDETEYNFGEKVYFWDWHKDNNKEDAIYNAGDPYKKWYIPKKYDNLEEEILQNEIETLDKDRYELAKDKAKRLIKLKSFKKLKSKNADKYWIGRKRADEFNYNILDGLSIKLEHIISIILYTDYDTLSYHFSRSFRKLSKNEPHWKFINRKTTQIRVKPYSNHNHVSH